MDFYDYFEEIILKKLEERTTTSELINKIKESSLHGKVGFYPSGRVSRNILKEIKQRYPEILPQIMGCFDRSEQATTETGIPVYHISQLDRLQSEMSLLVIASNTFYSKEEKELEQLANYKKSVLKVSNFELSLPKNMTAYEILYNIRDTHVLLADDKSRMTHMIAWLSRMLNDKKLTHLFEPEVELDEEQEPLVYKGFNIRGLDHTCKKELQAEFYKMKHVSPKIGDIVFDIGAYKGDTAMFFAHYVGKKGKVYAFEPVRANLDCLTKNVKKNRLKKIVIPINKGVSDKPGKLKAISMECGTPWAYLSDNNELTYEGVEVITLDNFVKSNNIPRVDFIKMDVEGLEEKVIIGAKKIISEMKPKLAIALYHKTSDLFTLPLLINEMSCGAYSIYMRSKIEGPFGFTLYAKKNEN